jgi:hypothetical protein
MSRDFLSDERKRGGQAGRANLGRRRDRCPSGGRMASLHSTVWIPGWLHPCGCACCCLGCPQPPWLGPRKGMLNSPPACPTESYLSPPGETTPPILSHMEDPQGTKVYGSQPIWRILARWRSLAPRHTSVWGGTRGCVWDTNLFQHTKVWATLNRCHIIRRCRIPGRALRSPRTRPPLTAIRCIAS